MREREGIEPDRSKVKDQESNEFIGTIKIQWKRHFKDNLVDIAASTLSK
jgi:hypothetical protein